MAERRFEGGGDGRTKQENVGGKTHLTGRSARLVLKMGGFIFLSRQEKKRKFTETETQTLRETHACFLSPLAFLKFAFVRCEKTLGHFF